jgi:acetylornithine/succinyldiaminopimelate/putrescine aminotransferase
MTLVHALCFGNFNDLNSEKALINDKTCAILMGIIQCGSRYGAGSGIFSSENAYP